MISGHGLKATLLDIALPSMSQYYVIASIAQSFIIHLNKENVVKTGK
jgi:hypothetical protein